jgi:hypothetical protein
VAEPDALFLLFNTPTMLIKSFYTKQHCFVSLKALYHSGIRTRVFWFLRQMLCPLRHVARANMIVYAYRKNWALLLGRKIIAPTKGKLTQEHKGQF